MTADRTKLNELRTAAWKAWTALIEAPYWCHVAQNPKAAARFAESAEALRTSLDGLEQYIADIALPPERDYMCPRCREIHSAPDTGTPHQFAFCETCGLSPAYRAHLPKFAISGLSQERARDILVNLEQGDIRILPEASVREILIAWFCWNDANGCFTDEDCAAEGCLPLTEETAVALYLADEPDDAEEIA